MVPFGGVNSGDQKEEAIEQIRVSFRLDPSVKDASLQVPTESIAVPATIRRSALSTVINHLLDRHVEDDDDDEKVDDNEQEDSDDDDENTNKKLQAISFDFLIGSSSNNSNQQLLRTSVQSAAKRLGLSTEQDIILTYFPAIPTPTLGNSSSKVPDWISCMSSFSSISSSNTTSDKTSFLCTGSYDGHVRIYNASSLSTNSTTKLTKDVFEPMATLSAHQGPIKCLAVSAAAANVDDTQEAFWIATGSLDQTLVVQQYQPENQRSKRMIHCQEGHSSSIGSLAFRRDGDNGRESTFASGDWDGGLCIWDLQSAVNNNPANDDLPPSGKKHKSSSRSSAKQQQHEEEEVITGTATPTVRIQAHANQISGICWNATTTSDSMITGSWDHSLKVWNVERQDCILTLNGSRVVTCLDASRHSPSVVATGHPDCSIRLWDVRTPQQQQQQQQQHSEGNDQSTLVVSDNTALQPSHKAWITQVQWSRQNPYQLASTSHDGTLKLWDIRSALPLSTVRVVSNKEDKAMCLCFDNDDQGRSVIFTGGTDGIVHQYHL